MSKIMFTYVCQIYPLLTEIKVYASVDASTVGCLDTRAFLFVLVFSAPRRTENRILKAMKKV